MPMVVLVTTWTALILDRLLAKEHGWQYIVTQFVIHVQVKFLAILVSAQRFLKSNNYVLFITILYLFDLTGPALTESISENADLTFMQIAKSTGNVHWVDNMTHHN